MSVICTAQETPHTCCHAVFKIYIRPKNRVLLPYMGCFRSCISSMWNFDIVQNRLYDFMGDELFFKLQSLTNRHNAASLSPSYFYYYSRCSDDLHSFVPLIPTFTYRTRHVPGDRLPSFPPWSFEKIISSQAPLLELLICGIISSTRMIPW